MERFRRKKSSSRVSKVTTIVDRSSNSWIDYYQGNQLVGKENNLPKSLEGDLRTFDVGRSSSSSRLPVGTTMKKLLAEELSNERESGRRSPSVIANLMGLDGWPAQLNSNRQQQKRSSDNHRHSPNTDGFRRSGKSSDSRSHRKHANGKQNYKDVYEVSERSNVETGSNMSCATSYRDRSEDEVAYVWQKFMDVKRFSTDEKFQQSKEFHEALEVLDSNKDLLLKFLQEPDSLFAKHLHHLHGGSESHCSYFLGSKSSNTLNCNVNVIGCHSGGEASQKIDISRSHKHRDKCRCNVYHRHSVDSHKLNFPAVVKEDAASNPTKIVVLKPNLGKARNAARSVSSTTPCDPASDSESHNECSDIRLIGSELRVKRNRDNDFDVYGRKSRESRALAREITCRMRNKLGGDSFNVSTSGYKGYSADESSRDISENDSSYESEVTILSSKSSFKRSILDKASALHHMESSVNREAKKRLSERWKMTHRSQDVGVSGKGSTLAEMLAIPDVDVRRRYPDTVVAEDESSRKCGRVGGRRDLTAPLGISSRDGWKDGCVSNLTRSRSLPASSNHLGSPKFSTRHEASTAERFLIRKKSSGHGRTKDFKRDSKIKEEPFSESTRSRNKEYMSTFVEMIDDIQEVQSSVDMVKYNINGKDSPDVKAVILELPTCGDDTSSTLDTLVVDNEHNNVYRSLDCPDEPVTAPKMSSSDLHNDDRFHRDVQSMQQEPSATTQPESPVSSKESEQPSPVSVLEAPFVEELSSGSECFERVSAGLHGLRMQLQLLKLESEGYDEGSVLVSSDECGEESTELDDDGEGFHHAAESWESSYLVDVLTDSGLDDIDSDMFLKTWHSADCPISPWVFENLEKKYCGYESCPRSERKLLFDCISAGIIQIFLQNVDMEPWVKPIVRNVSPRWWRDGLQAQLHNLLKNHEKKVIESAVDVIILNGMEWLNLGDSISSVGSDIERLLIDELVEELIPL